MLEFLTIIGFAILVAMIIAIVLLVPAVLLRAAVSLHNRCVGGDESPKAVAIPSLVKAVGIMLLITIVGSHISSGIEQVVSLMGAEWLVETELATYGSFSLDFSFVPSMALQFLAAAIVLTWLLPTRFSRALGVSACHAGICILVGAVAIGLGFAGSVLVEQLI
jgi:hypothetical protein